MVANASYTINEREIVLDSSAFVPPEMAALLPPTEPFVIQAKEYASWNVSVVQPLFSGTALPMLRGAYRNAQSVRESERAAEQAIRAGVARAYYGVLTAREGEAIAEAAVATTKQGEELAKRSVLAGLSPNRASLQAELARSQAERDLRNATATRVQAEQAFARLTGLPADAPVELPPEPAVPSNLDGAVETARTTRPDVQAARYQVDAARFAHQAHWAGWLPAVDGRFTYNWSENVGFTGQRGFWMVVVEGKWTLWDGGYRIAKAKETASQLHMADYAATRQEDLAVEEVRVAWEGYSRAASALESMGHELALAEQNLEQAQAGFGAGSTTWLELETAQLQLRATRLSQLVERMNRDLAAIDLERAIGTL